MSAERLLRLIEDIKKAVQNLSEEVREANNKTEKARENISPEVSLRAEVNLPEGVEIHKSAADADNDEKYQSRTLLVSSLTLVVLFLTLSVNLSFSLSFLARVMSKVVTIGAAFSAA